MRNRVIALMLTLTMLTGMMTTWASAGTFADMEEHWAEEYVERLYSLGLANGTSTTAFSPSNAMTYAEALLFCSRISGLSDEDKTAIAEKWYDQLADIIPSGQLSWTADEIAICVELGIISLVELADVCDAGFTSSISREVLCMYIVRALQLTAVAESLTSYTTAYTDAADIDSQYMPYVYLLSLYGIIEGNGGGTFDPDGSIKRGQMAAILCRGLDVIESKGILIESADFNEYDSWVVGTVSTITTDAFGESTIVLSSEISGMSLAVIPSDTPVYDYNMSSSLAVISQGDDIRVNYDSDGQVISVVVGGNTTTSSGTVYSISQDEIVLWGDSGYEVYQINSFTEVSTGSASGDSSIIDVMDNYATAQCTVNALGQLTSLTLQGGTHVVEGVITNFSYDTTNTLYIQVLGLDGVEDVYPTATTISVEINGVTGTLYSGLVGSFITMYCADDSGEVELAQVDTTTTYIQGAIKSYSTTSTTPYLYVTDLDSGDYTKYYVDSSVVYMMDGQELTMEELVKGWFVTAIYDEDLATFTYVWCAEDTYYVSGTLMSISYNNASSTATLELALDDGTISAYTVSVKNMPTIYRNDATSSIGELLSGDYLTLAVQYNLVSEIQATAQSATVMGTIYSISKIASGTTLTVVLDNGYTQSYALSSTASATLDGSAISINDLEAEQEIAMVIVNDVVVAVEVFPASATTGTIVNIMGMVIATDTTANTMTISLDDSSTTITVDVSSASFASAGSSSSLYLRSFSEGDSVGMYGSYSGGTFYATAVTRFD